MGSNYNINAAYVASWKENNSNLNCIKIDGKFLECNNEKIDISDIYMQDILLNQNLFYSINSINAEDLFNIIKIHVNAIKIKERQLRQKVRRLNEYGTN